MDVRIQITEAIPYSLALKPWRFIKPKSDSIYIWLVNDCYIFKGWKDRDLGR